MNQDVPPGDMLFGAMVLAIFLVFVFALGFVLTRFKNLRFTRAWGPLIPIINGRVIHDGGGAATSWLSGTYRGRPVRATMAPDQNRYSGESGDRYNYFDVGLLEVPGSQDWSIEYRHGVWGIQQEGWHIESKDKALEERLRASGILDLMTRFGMPEINYSARGRSLQYSEDVTPLWTPMPERFREGMDLLFQLAEINAKVNPAAAR